MMLGEVATMTAAVQASSTAAAATATTKASQRSSSQHLRYPSPAIAATGGGRRRIEMLPIVVLFLLFLLVLLRLMMLANANNHNYYAKGILSPTIGAFMNHTSVDYIKLLSVGDGITRRRRTTTTTTTSQRHMRRRHLSTVTPTTTNQASTSKTDLSSSTTSSRSSSTTRPTTTSRNLSNQIYRFDAENADTLHRVSVERINILTPPATSASSSSTTTSSNTKPTVTPITYVDYLGFGSYIEFTNVVVDQTGVYNISVAYTAGIPDGYTTSRPLDLIIMEDENSLNVNSGTGESVRSATSEQQQPLLYLLHYDMNQTKDWRDFQVESHVMGSSSSTSSEGGGNNEQYMLRAGTPYTIRLVAIRSVGPNVDYVELSPIYTIHGDGSGSGSSSGVSLIRPALGTAGSSSTNGGVGDGSGTSSTNSEGDYIHVKFGDNDNPDSDNNIDHPEITMRYYVHDSVKIPNDVSWSISTFDCETPADTNGILDSSVVVVIDDDDSSSDERMIELQININEAGLYDSNIWWHSSSESSSSSRSSSTSSIGQIMLCARVEVSSSDRSIFLTTENMKKKPYNYHETILSQPLVLSSSFELSTPMEVIPIVDDVVITDAEPLPDDTVSACVCDYDTYECVNTNNGGRNNLPSFSINSMVHLCVKSINPNLQVNQVTELIFEQEQNQVAGGGGGGYVTYPAITKSQANALTNVELIDLPDRNDRTTRIVSIKTPLITPFFVNQDDPQDIHVNGHALLEFRTTDDDNSKKRMMIRDLTLKRTTEDQLTHERASRLGGRSRITNELDFLNDNNDPSSSALISQQLQPLSQSPTLSPKMKEHNAAALSTFTVAIPLSRGRDDGSGGRSPSGLSIAVNIIMVLLALALAAAYYKRYFYPDPQNDFK